MDTKNKADGECWLNKSDDNIVKVYHKSGMLYFRPETEEIIVVPPQEAGDFEAHCLDMLGHVDEFHKANDAYSAALEKYRQQRQEPGMMLNAEPGEAEVIAAENEREKKREALLDKLRDGETSDMGYQDVVELLPLLESSKQGSGKHRLGRRYVYAKLRYFSGRSGGGSQTEAGKKWHTVSLKNKDTATGKGSIYSADSRGRRIIDTKKLKEQLSGDRLPKLKLGLKDYINLDDYNLDETLSDWAKSWNDSLNGSHSFDNGIEISGAAQFMRFISNAGAEAEFNAKDGYFSIKGDTKASVAVASGIGSAVFYIPDQLGWSLRYLPEKKAGGGKTDQVPEGLDMGVVRIYLENQLIGFAGASAQLESQFQVMIKDNKQQIVAGQPRGRLPRFYERQKGRRGQFYNQMKKEDEGVSVGAEVFAGVSAEYSLKGAVQWLKPAPVPPWNGHISKAVGGFADLATIGASIAGLAGIGAGAKFLCTFINGKFCFKIAASLCCGPGAKGAFICEVGVKAWQEFGSWLAYQLFALDYHFFELVSKKAFETFTRMCVMQIMGVTNDVYHYYNELKHGVGAIQSEFTAFIDTLIEASKERNQLAKNIIANPEQLLTCTPEAKGILLYLLTRHGIPDHFDAGNRNMVVDIYHERKEAIIQVLYSIQTRREWIKVMYQRSKGGSVRKEEHVAEEQVAEKQVQELREFLQEGFNRDKEMFVKLDELRIKEINELLDSIYNRLKNKDELSLGYALAMNNTPWYNVNRISNPHFPRRCDSGPVKQL